VLVNHPTDFRVIFTRQITQYSGGFRTTKRPIFARLFLPPEYRAYFIIGGKSPDEITRINRPFYHPEASRLSADYAGEKSVDL
jgi:hypothetical protein